MAYPADDYPAAVDDVSGYVPLEPVTVTVRAGGVNVRAEPVVDSPRIGTLAGGQQVPALGLVYGDFTWLHVMLEDDELAWIAGEFTDFSRSPAYNQVAGMWYETGAVLSFRYALLRDLFRVRGAGPDKLAQVENLRPDTLLKLEDTLTRQTMVAQYTTFWRMQRHLGMPDPFEYFPVHVSPPDTIGDMELNGFGPSTAAFENWTVYFDQSRGLSSGVDYFVPEGSPLIAVSDGVIQSVNFLGSPAEKSLALRPYLPVSRVNPDGPRALSNVIVGYGHLTGNPTSMLVREGDVVRAGQIIGTSGWPVYVRDDRTVGIQHNNAHLHLEVHFVTDGRERLGSRCPVNPLLFWSPRLIALQARLASQGRTAPYPTSGQPYGRLGFFSIGAFCYEPATPCVWEHEPRRDAVWPEGVYDLDAMLAWLRAFTPYPSGGVE
ncbi:MAG: SH3 domain-containing protein [Anaerolineae bacterium]|nr:SH3 domain-containing protein [Anaerolineae bacterium]